MDVRERAACRARGLVPLDYPDSVAADWPELLEIVERLVKPERHSKKGSERDAPWWLHLRARPSLRAAAAELENVTVIRMVSPHTSFVINTAKS